MRSIIFSLCTILTLSTGSAHAAWYFQGQESAFNVPGTYVIFNEHDDGYAFSIWCQPDGLFAIFSTPEILDNADVPDRAKTPVVMLFRADDNGPRYYVSEITSDQRRLRIEAAFDPLAVRQMLEAKTRIAVAMQGSSVHYADIGIRVIMP